MRKPLCFLSIILCIFLAINAKSQSIDLGITNISQEKQAWCWAATAQQVIYWLTGNSYYQCQLVDASLQQPPGTCCLPATCNVPGNLNQIRSLILQFGGAVSTISPPAHPEIIFNTL